MGPPAAAYTTRGGHTARVVYAAAGGAMCSDSSGGSTETIAREGCVESAGAPRMPCKAAAAPARRPRVQRSPRSPETDVQNIADAAFAPGKIDPPGLQPSGTK